MIPNGKESMSMLSTSVKGLSSSNLTGLQVSLSGSSWSYSGYLFKRSNKPHDGSKELNLVDLDTAAPPTREQSYNELDTSDPTNGKKSRKEDIFKSELPQLALSNGMVSQSKTQLEYDIPILPSLTPKSEGVDFDYKNTLPEVNEIKKESDGVSNAVKLLSSFLGFPTCCCDGSTEKKKESILSDTDAYQSGPSTEINEYQSTAIHVDSILEPPMPMRIQPQAVTQPKPFLTKEPTRSLPISIARSSYSNDSLRSPEGRTFRASNGRLPLHETFGEPYLTPSYEPGDDDSDDSAKSEPPPQSYIDSVDGHVWRSKYCVLSDGVLYFYKNAKIGNSREAELERSQMISHPTYKPGIAVDEADHLGKSPMPRNLHPMLSAKEKNGGGSFCHDPSVLWEKRVALNMVGAVRSSPDFGECAFELIALSTGDDDDDVDSSDDEVDRLVLRSIVADEMSSWIFEIHKSFVLLMKQLAAVVGSNDSRSSSHMLVDPQSFSTKALHPPSIPAMKRGRSTSARTDLISPNSPLLGPIFGTPVRNSPETLSSLLLKRKGSRSVRRRSIGVHEGWNVESANELDDRRAMRMRSSSDEFLDTMTFQPPLANIPSFKISSSRSSTRLSEEASLSTEKSVSFDQISPSVSEDVKRPKIEPVSNKYIPPHLRKGASSQKYVPPHLRKKIESEADLIIPMKSVENGGSDIILETPLDLRDQVKLENEEFEYLQLTDSKHSSVPADESSFSSSSSINSTINEHDDKFGKRGGCADPFLVKESICDDSYIAHGASKVTLDHTAYGTINKMSEIGAASKIGIRDYNEDAYLILNDILKIQPSDDLEPFDPSDSFFDQFDYRGLIAIFDGHCGNEAARYAAEKLQSIIIEESLNLDIDSGTSDYQSILHQILLEAVTRLDDDFCEFCSQGGRDWYSGSTAIIALVLDDHIAVASVGDASGVVSASTGNVDRALMHDWRVLAEDESELDDELNKIGGSTKGTIYKEVTESHCPNRPEEKERIHAANGWVTHETEIPIITQFQRMDWGDRDVLDIFLRCFSDRLNTQSRILDIYRVCGDLAVSRAIGDKEYKAAFNQDPDSNLGDNEWRSPAPMPFNTYRDIHNEEHSGLFEGDLVISTPAISFFELNSHGTDEFLLIACDGFWDVIDPDDAVRVTRNLLFGVEISARECAERLAQIAKGLGSSDNITVIVVKFFGK